MSRRSPKRKSRYGSSIDTHEIEARDALSSAEDNHDYFKEMMTEGDCRSASAALLAESHELGRAHSDMRAGHSAEATISLNEKLGSDYSKQRSKYDSDRQEFQRHCLRIKK